MISTECHAGPEEADDKSAQGLTDDELGLRTPQPEQLISDIEKHLRDIGLYSDK